MRQKRSWSVASSFGLPDGQGRLQMRRPEPTVQILPGNYTWRFMVLIKRVIAVLSTVLITILRHLRGL